MKTVTIYCPEGVTCEVINAEPPPIIEPPPVAGWATLPNLTLNAGSAIALSNYYNGTQTGYAATKPLPAGVTLAPATGILTAATTVANATLADLAFSVGVVPPVEPPIEPPIEPPVGTGEWVLDEAVMTSLEWKHGKPWVHKWGDWRGKDMTDNGGPAWKALTNVPSWDWAQPPLAVKFDGMEDMVREWIAHGNRGVVIRGGNARVWTRSSAAATKPFLTVNGTRCECTASGYLDGGSVVPVNSREYCGIYAGEGDIEKFCIQFDLSPIPAGVTINSASVTIFCPKVEAPQLYAYLLWPPA